MQFKAVLQKHLSAYCTSTADAAISPTPIYWFTAAIRSCFMSSIDLHTHAGYQAMLPEAVAVVIAPRDTERRVGVFRLETPHGLKLILDCRLTGFHPHPEDVRIYGDARVRWDGGGEPLRIVDLR